ATGNVVLDVNSEIRANGGDSLYAPTDYPGGGGAGGSVKIIAGGNVINRGHINVNGGKGGNSSKQANECGGGGAGGRVAIFCGGTYTEEGEGLITATGGSKGFYNIAGASIAENGQNGTILIADSANPISPKRASAPTPRNGDGLVYCPSNPTSIDLKWYSGYGATDDRVWFGTSEATMVAQGTAGIAATRGQHSVSVNVNKDATYYWQVKTDSNSIPSQVFSFSTVGWECPVAVGSSSTEMKYISGPTWDVNRDCALTAEDIWYFAKDWRVSKVSGTQDYTLEGAELHIFAAEWLECVNRTNGDCATNW
ncbi:MAG: fibronectin type III domain-containing protein, partial [Phycisphaerae bacterium]|nr:fibronectin type III domain-containing protein [Phycisphaerae bacterium]